MAEDTPPRIGNVLYPVSDVSAAVEFYSTLGMPLTFRDGDAFAAFDAGTTFAIASVDEAIGSGTPAASLRVADVDSATSAAEAAGARIVSPPHDGPHERRATVRDPWGNAVILYSSLPASGATS